MITEEIKNGIIMKATAGFYYVKGPGGNIMECRARGVFRKQKITPLVGDKVTVTFDGESGTVTEIYKRKNFLLRPPVANIQKLIIVASVDEPKPNLYIIDKLTAQAYNQEITPVVVFSKADLGDFEKYAEIYNNAGIKSFGVSSKTGQGIDEFKKIFENSLCALTGNTGVGKSSILNSLAPELSLATAHISSKLGRGRHTTRTVELYELFGGLIADTPGFSALEFEGSELIVKENLQFCFPEIEKYIGNCKFVSCAHIGEKGCAVGEALKKGEISQSRYDSYRMMYDEVKDYREWENK